MAEIFKLFDKSEKEKPVNYENFYSGAYTPLQAEFGEYFTGYRIPSAEIGAPTSPQTADQIRQASRLLNTGLKVVEAGTIDPSIFETIPQQHFQEMNRLSKLTGTNITIHGPIIDPAGFTQQGWREEERLKTEREMKKVIEQSQKVDPKGSVPVTFHAGAMPIQTWVYDETHPEKRRQEYLVAVEPESGQMQALRYEEKVWPDNPKMQLNPKRRIDVMNFSQWEQNKQQLFINEEQKARLARLAPPEDYVRYRPVISDIRTGRADPNEVARLSQEDKERLRKVQDVVNGLDEANFSQYSLLREMYNDMVKTGFDSRNPEEERIKNDFMKRVQNVYSEYGPGSQIARNQGVRYNDKLVSEIRSEILRVEQEVERRREDLYRRGQIKGEDVGVYPRKWRPADDFGREKAAQTVGKVMFDAWKKFGNNAPTMALENYPGTIATFGDELKDLIGQARKKFVEEARKEGKSEGAAKVAAEKLIGATWDYGHINMLRQFGFPREIGPKELAKVAKDVKKAHIADNFGFHDAHLPPGMGDVPLKESFKVLEKAGVKVPQITEAGAFVAQFRTSPHPYVLEALGSPMYTYMLEPFWNQTRQTYGSYFAGYGEFLPDFHFRTYGAPSFSALPSELGGEMPGEARQRFGPQQME